jgi:hypothetical protein
MEQKGLFYVMAVASNQHLWLGFKQVRVNQIVRQIRKDQRRVHSAGEGSKGPRALTAGTIQLRLSARSTADGLTKDICRCKALFTQPGYVLGRRTPEEAAVISTEL